MSDTTNDPQDTGTQDSGAQDTGTQGTGTQGTGTQGTGTQDSGTQDTGAQANSGDGTSNTGGTDTSNTDNTNDPPSKSGSSTTSAVNKQILDAVQASTEYAFGLNNQLQTDPGTDRLSAGAAIAYDKAAQAAALGVQDATDYERNVLSISSATQGKALAMILAGDNVPDATIAFVLSLISSVVAPLVVYEVGAAQTKMLNNFP